MGLVGGRWHLSLEGHCRWSDSLVSEMVVIVSQTWRKGKEKQDYSLRFL